MGDPAGIGGELILKALDSLSLRSIPVIVGDASVLAAAAGLLFQDRRFRFKPFMQGSAGDAELLDLGFAGNVRLGRTDATCGDASYRYIVEALKLALSGEVSAIVTCPINKESIRSAGVRFIGHTEMLAHFAGVKEYVMMMMTNRRLRVSLVTIHVPLKDVPPLITQERVFACIAITDRALRCDFDIRTPRINVCGLNPHAGEHGVMGTEESVIVEAIDRARALGIRVEGPFPADSLFHKVDCDAYVAMYHDQGLIPVKTVGFARAVNITLGLPFVRTSVGHGTGLDIAGTGQADPTSLIEAYRSAESIVAARSRNFPR